MSGYTKSLLKMARPVLQADETLLAALRAMPKGSTSSIVGGAAGAVVGGAIGAALGASRGAEARSEAREQVAGAGLPALPPQVALGLTDKRLLVFARSAMSGKAKNLIGEIPRQRIRSMSGVPSGNRVTPDSVRVHLVDDIVLEFEVVKLDGYERFVAAF